ncbi:M48 family metallopeptidase [Gilliamella sp. B3023]|uniref:beta-barrel assembly-enhancing protease n=1 Tax=Gilliamella sp. B3023 TaxID=2817987 RepID=UPI002269A412|nr:M48 family metalloprotease [Gilliamella sp. B3023]MCX8673724.1 M48 family metallopeptidase [Gilliamella sp. B3023]
MLKKAIALVLSTSLFLQNTHIVYAADNITLPEMGTAAATTLSIGQEKEMGDYYVRLLRGSAPIANDPVLNQYINNLGKKLVSKSESVQTPFHFYIMKSNVLNAFAFFGGNVVIHSRIIMDTDNESQLASVMAHEIGHVTQRHLARAMEAQNKNSPYVWGGALGSLLLTLANPEAGMAAMTTTMASSTQSMISFTQSNEQEADRVGLRTIAKAGFDPHASSEFLQKLADQSRFSSKPPEILMTHPLPNSRLSDMRNRSLQYSKKNVPSSLSYYLAKARIAILMGNNNTAKLLLDNYRKLNTDQGKKALTYAVALSNYKSKNLVQAKIQLQPLLDNDPDNIWYIDLMTDINLESNNNKEAIARLQSALKRSPDNAVLQLNLANAYIKDGQYQQAVSLLHRYTFDHNDDTNGWDLLVTAYGGIKSRAQEMSARAESIALEGRFPEAIQLLTNARAQAKGNQTLISKIDARINQLKQLQKRYAAYSRR